MIEIYIREEKEKRKPGSGPGGDGIGLVSTGHKRFGVIVSISKHGLYESSPV